MAEVQSYPTRCSSDVLNWNAITVVHILKHLLAGDVCLAHPSVFQIKMSDFCKQKVTLSLDVHCKRFTIWLGNIISALMMLPMSANKPSSSEFQHQGEFDFGLQISSSIQKKLQYCNFQLQTHFSLQNTQKPATKPPKAIQLTSWGTWSLLSLQRWCSFHF